MTVRLGGVLKLHVFREQASGFEGREGFRLVAEFLGQQHPLPVHIKSFRVSTATYPQDLFPVKEKRMSLYARSDVMSVSIPPTSGGCGQNHTRPVNRGAPVKTWKLTCSQCESFLRADNERDIISVIPGDKDKGIPQKQVRVKPMNPHWSTTPYRIPKTPDEDEHGKMLEDQIQREKDAVSLIALAKSAGMELTPLLQQHLNTLATGDAGPESVFCAKGHSNPMTVKYCGECGMTMEASDELPTAMDPEDVFPLESLHIATIKKKARDLGLSDKGTKDALISRIKEATT